MNNLDKDFVGEENTNDVEFKDEKISRAYDPANIVDINCRNKCVEINISSMVKRIKGSFGDPLVNVELHEPTLEYMIEGIIEIHIDNIQEHIYREAREEAKKILYNVRSKYKGQQLLGGGEISNDII